MIIFEIIAYIIMEIIFEKTIKGFFKLFRKLGILVLKILTLSNTSFEELDKEYYKDSSKPYLIVLILVIGIVFLL